MKIKIFSSFCESQNCKSVFERLCETQLMKNYGADKEIYITNGDDYTHVIIMNTAMPRIKPEIPKSNVVGLAFEPPPFLGLTPLFLEYAKVHIGKYFIGEKYNLGEPFMEHYGYMWHITPLSYIPLKTKLCSIIISQKQQTRGHQYRHQLVKQILQSNLPIDIYGRGCCYYTMLDSRIKGEFTELEPYESYSFHVCIENLETNHYFSEKLVNPLLCENTPIYLGSRKIEEYFPNTIYKLSGNVDQDFELLKRLVENPEVYIKKIDVNGVKEKINILKNLDFVYSAI